VVGWLVTAPSAKAADNSNPTERPPAGWLRVEQSGAWCGAKGLWLVCRAYGMDREFDEIKAICDPDNTSGGYISLAALQRAAEQLGLAALSIKSSLDWLKGNRIPALTVHRFHKPRPDGATEEVYHCCLLFEYDGQKFHALDPYLPAEELQLTDEEFAKTWTGEALLVTRDPADLPRTTNWLWYIPLILVGNVLLFVGIVWAARRWRSVGPVMAAGVALVLLGCTRQAPPPDRANTSVASALQFDARLHETAEPILVDPGERPTSQHTFRFRNVGTEPVSITTIKPACSCSTVGHTQTTIPPGGQGTITFAVDLEARRGRFETYALVYTDQPNAIATKLTTADMVLRRPGALPNVVEYTSAVAGRPVTQTVEVSVDLKPGEDLGQVTVKSGRPGITCQVGDPRVEVAGEQVRVATVPLRVGLTAERAGTLIEDTLTVSFARPPRGSLTIPVRAQPTHPQFTASPSSINFGPIPAAGATKKVTLRASGAGPLPKLVARLAPDARVKVRLEGATDQAERVVTVEVPAAAGRFLEGEIVLEDEEGRSPPYILRYMGYAGGK
jgi:hypothetical protein